MIVSVSVALLFVMSGSMMPGGGVTVAVFDSAPAALLSSVAVAVNVAVPPRRRSTVWLMFPEPLATPQLEPSEAAHVHVTPMRLPGKVSVTAPFVDRLGPPFLTVIVYVTGLPASTEA